MPFITHGLSFHDTALDMTYLSKGFEDFIEMLNKDHRKMYLLLQNNYDVIKNMVLLPNHAVGFFFFKEILQMCVCVQAKFHLKCILSLLLRKRIQGMAFSVSIRLIRK